MNNERKHNSVSRKVAPESLGALGVAVVCSVLLLWALMGTPPYAFFTALKWAVAISNVYVVWVLFKQSRALAPICLVLLTLALIHMFGRMRREEWAFFNWSEIAALAVAALVLLVRREEGY